MSKIIGPLAIALAFGIGSIACDRGAERRTDATGTKREATGEKRDATAKRSESPGMPSDVGRAAKMSDSDLKKEVESKIKSDDKLKSAKIDVDANADKNEVTLKGTVPSEDMRSKAVELAKSAQPGVTVNDKIDVK